MTWARNSTSTRATYASFSQGSRSDHWRTWPGRCTCFDLSVSACWGDGRGSPHDPCLPGGLGSGRTCVRLPRRRGQLSCPTATSLLHLVGQLDDLREGLHGHESELGLLALPKELLPAPRKEGVDR